MPAEQIATDVGPRVEYRIVLVQLRHHECVRSEMQLIANAPFLTPLVWHLPKSFFRPTRPRWQRRFLIYSRPLIDPWASCVRPRCNFSGLRKLFCCKRTGAFNVMVGHKETSCVSLGIKWPPVFAFCADWISRNAAVAPCRQLRRRLQAVN